MISRIRPRGPLSSARPSAKSSLKKNVKLTKPKQAPSLEGASGRERTPRPTTKGPIARLNAADVSADGIPRRGARKGDVVEAPRLPPGLPGETIKASDVSGDSIARRLVRKERLDRPTRSDLEAPRENPKKSDGALGKKPTDSFDADRIARGMYDVSEGLASGGRRPKKYTPDLPPMPLPEQGGPSEKHPSPDGFSKGPRTRPTRKDPNGGVFDISGTERAGGRKPKKVVSGKPGKLTPGAPRKNRPPPDRAATPARMPTSRLTGSPDISLPDASASQGEGGAKKAKKFWSSGE